MTVERIDGPTPDEAISRVGKLIEKGRERTKRFSGNHCMILYGPEKAMVFTKRIQNYRPDLADYLCHEHHTPRHFVFTPTMVIFSLDVYLPSDPETRPGIEAVLDVLECYGMAPELQGNDVLIDSRKVAGTLWYYIQETGEYIETPAVQLGNENELLKQLLPQQEYRRWDQRIPGWVFDELTQVNVDGFIDECVKRFQEKLQWLSKTGESVQSSE